MSEGVDEAGDWTDKLRECFPFFLLRNILFSRMGEEKRGGKEEGDLERSIGVKGPRGGGGGVGAVVIL